MNNLDRPCWVPPTEPISTKSEPFCPGCAIKSPEKPERAESKWRPKLINAGRKSFSYREDIIHLCRDGAGLANFTVVFPSPACLSV